MNIHFKKYLVWPAPKWVATLDSRSVDLPNGTDANKVAVKWAVNQLLADRKTCDANRIRITPYVELIDWSSEYFRVKVDSNGSLIPIDEESALTEDQLADARSIDMSRD